MRTSTGAGAGAGGANVCTPHLHPPSAATRNSVAHLIAPLYQGFKSSAERAEHAEAFGFECSHHWTGRAEALYRSISFEAGMTPASHPAALLAALLAAAACSRPAAGAEDYAALRKQMVAEQIESRGISDARVLAAMRKVPREEFVPPELRPLAYQDHPLPIGDEQTISQPYIVALMTALAAARR